ncbi:Hypothetical protein, putative [Bodo saltans]|uniref:Uncharacterized protein n=1 Tax=Bodo saltans TaxID=75058 RepID=A0A0S4J6R1_BODSA|nr:Hypothetical protein, putative [Bodo saltans]|eukprot:CUG83691.1 Hypothetical protein, putative [Bodo saltans]
MREREVQRAPLLPLVPRTPATVSPRQQQPHTARPVVDGKASHVQSTPAASTALVPYQGSDGRPSSHVPKLLQSLPGSPSGSWIGGPSFNVGGGTVGASRGSSSFFFLFRSCCSRFLAHLAGLGLVVLLSTWEEELLGLREGPAAVGSPR